MVRNDEATTMPGSSGVQLLANTLGRLSAIIFLMMTAVVINFPQSPALSGQGQAGDVRDLKMGTPIERELPGGGTHSYRVTITSPDQYLYVIVDQRGIDVAVRLFAPGGNTPLKEIDSPNGTQGPEPISIVPGSPGAYRLDVVSPDGGAPAGNYEVRIAELRLVTAEEKKLLGDAESAYERGAKLREEKSDEARRGAVKEFEEASRLWAIAGNHWREADMLSYAGYTYFIMGDYQKAIDFYRREQSVRKRIGDLTGEAQALTNIGGLYAEMDEFQTALNFYEQALPLREAVRNPGGEAVTLNGMGVVYEAFGDHQKAVEMYRRVLPLRRAANDRLGWAVTTINIGRILTNQGEYQEALELFNEALPVVQAVHEPENEADALLNIGRVHLYLGHYSEALESFNKALNIQEGENRLYWRDVSLNNIGVVYEAQGDYTKALEFYNKSLDIQKVTKNRRNEAHGLNNIGRVYSTQGRHAEALEYLTKALPLMREVSDQRGEAITLNRLGYVYNALGDKEKAFNTYTKALQIDVNNGDRAGEAGVRYNLASLQRDRGDLAGARAQIDKALEIIKSMGMAVANRKLRESYFASTQNYYDFMIDTLMQLHRRNPSRGHAAEAFYWSERARARSLLELLAEAGKSIRKGVDPKLLERERSLSRQLNSTLETQIRLLSRPHPQEAADVVARKLDALTTDYEQVQVLIRRASPEYAALKIPEPAGLVEIQQQAIDRDTILLEYSLGENRSYLWVVTSSSFHAIELPNSYSEIRTKATSLIDLLAKTGGTVQRFELLAGELSKMLLPQEVTAQLTRKKKVVIVANGLLQYVPFAALSLPDRTGNYKPLVADHEVISLPSASTITVVRRKTAGRAAAPNTVVVFADPVFSAGDARFKVLPASPKTEAAGEKLPAVPSKIQGGEDAIALLLTRADNTAGAEVMLPRLKGTEAEADLIKKVVPSARVYSGFDADLESVTGQSGGYRIVHFATHGIAPDETPDLAGVVLSLLNERGESQDGFLGLPRVYNLNLRADLVVLSACETGLGKDVRGEGLVGLTRGFMYAGSPRVVASLWKVQEDATKEMMDKFYTAMFRDGMTPAAALRSAQASMWQEQKWAPSDWAGFAFFGEWR